jgi:hypothetical protein
LTARNSVFSVSSRPPRNVGNHVIAVLQLEATPAAVRRRYMAVAG